jgi:DNA-binding protein YbaB
LLLNNGKEGLKNLVYYQIVTKAVPSVLKGIFDFVNRRVQARMKRQIERLSTMSVKNKTSSIVLQRDYEKENDHNMLFDAVLSHVSELPQTKHVKRTTTGVFIMATTDEIEISPCIYIRKVTEAQSNEKISKLVIEVYSYTYDLTTLRKFMEEIEEKYMMAISNQLGKNIFYFDEIPIHVPMGLNKKPDLSKAPSRLVFSKYPLYTNKSLRNIYGDSVKVIRKRVDFFINNKRWYEEKGVPYTLGLLLHGVPGAGKTSCIKSIAKDTNRHVLNIRLSESTTVSQLNALFYSSQVQVVQNGENKFYDIPIDKRIIVLEDVDCLTDVVLSREAVEEAKKNNQADEIEKKVEDKELDMYGRNVQLSSYQNPMSTSGVSQKLNLSILLNILDGVLEQPGRILIMTSNHPEKLDKALIRPGRIDVIVKFDYCKRHEVAEIIEAFTGKKVSKKEIERVADMVFTPAEVTRVIFENIDSIDDIILNLEKNPHSLPEQLKSVASDVIVNPIFDTFEEKHDVVEQIEQPVIKETTTSVCEIEPIISNEKDDIQQMKETERRFYMKELKTLEYMSLPSSSTFANSNVENSFDCLQTGNASGYGLDGLDAFYQNTL